MSNSIPAPTQSSFRAQRWYLVTPSANPLPDGAPGALTVTVAGNIELIDDIGNVLLKAVEVGDLPYRPSIIGTNTTATVYALY